MKHSIDELAEIFHEQALFKKYPDFHDYVKKSYPEWFEDQHLINLKREFRKDFLCELDFFDIEEKKCQSNTDEDDGDGEESYYCNKCYCHHSRESEKQEIENEGKSRKDDDEEARKEDEMSCDVETIRRELMKLMEKEQQKDANKQNCESRANSQAESVESYLKDVPSTSNAHQKLERSSDVDGDDESSSGEQSI
ncbi:hypothetical protein CAEBREN_11186 [Caenorhabditis brenneri]|uniref:Uncharacterized protein n=1 Tax=Caenorhabditis brenneri TaxID=135651 RepID=G0MHC3_CAEBE|nr:hypothetical protein CAEBREN_11186 [Caenorhabditis brenneri]